MKRLIMLTVSIVVTFGCAPTPERGNHVRSQATTTNERRVVLFEIEEMPKEAFLDFVSKTPGLRNDERRVVKNDISVDVYTHCSLVKYQSDGNLFMDISQFYQGGSGSQSYYIYKDRQWIIFGGVEYD